MALLRWNRCQPKTSQHDRWLLWTCIAKDDTQIKLNASWILLPLILGPCPKNASVRQFTSSIIPPGIFSAHLSLKHTQILRWGGDQRQLKTEQRTPLVCVASSYIASNSDHGSTRYTLLLSVSFYNNTQLSATIDQIPSSLNSTEPWWHLMHIFETNLAQETVKKQSSTLEIKFTRLLSLK